MIEETNQPLSDRHGETVSGLLVDVHAIVKRIERMYETQIDERLRVKLLYHLGEAQDALEEL